LNLSAVTCVIATLSTISTMANQKIRSLPGDKCRFYKFGRCHYEETLNPGYNANFRCRLLAEWEGRFEEFVSRADRFNLDPETAGRIWAERMRSFYTGESECDQFERGGSRSEIECVHAFLDVCLLKLPQCLGQCSHFQLRARGERGQG
jgi:hypothetical protein